MANSYSKDSYAESSGIPVAGTKRENRSPHTDVMPSGCRYMYGPPDNFVNAPDFQLGFAPVYDWNHHCNMSCLGKD